MNKLRFRQFWVIILLTAILAALQSYKIFSEEDNAKNLNAPFFGQDAGALGQQYTQQQADEQKKIDAQSGKTKSKDNSNGSVPQNLQNRDNESPPGSNAPPDSLQPNTAGPGGPVQPASDQPKPGQTPPPGELNRGY